MPTQQNITTKRLPDPPFSVDAPLLTYLNDLIRELELSFQDQNTVQNAITSSNTTFTSDISALNINLASVNNRVSNVSSVLTSCKSILGARITSVNAKAVSVNNKLETVSININSVSAITSVLEDRISAVSALTGVGTAVNGGIDGIATADGRFRLVTVSGDIMILS